MTDSTQRHGDTEMKIPTAIMEEEYERRWRREQIRKIECRQRARRWAEVRDSLPVVALVLCAISIVGLILLLNQ